MTRVLSLSALATIVALATWVCWPSNPTLPAAIGHLAPAVGDAPTTTLAGSTATPSATDPAASDTPRQLVESTGDAPGVDTFEVRVVDDASSTPARGAVVAFINATQQARMQQVPAEELAKLAGDRSALLRRFGATAIADERGIALLPAERGTYVRGSVGRTVGQLIITDPMQAPTGGWTLRLHAMGDLTVLVVDPDGAPLAELPIGVLTSADIPDVGPRRQMAIPLGKSGPNGALVVPDAYSTIAMMRELIGDVADAEIGVQMPGREPLGVPIDLENLPVEPVRLVVGSIGSVMVEVMAADGTPFEGKLQVYLTEKGAERRGSWGPTSVEGHTARFSPVATGTTLEVQVQSGSMGITRTIDGPTRHGETATARIELPAAGRVTVLVAGPVTAEKDYADLSVTDGSFRTQQKFDAERRVVFDAVPVGATLELEAWISGVRVAKSIVGPARPGQEVAVRLAMPADVVTVRGRAVDARGEPLRDRTLILQVRHDRGGPSAFTRSDAEGRFQRVMEGLANHRVTYLRVVLAHEYSPSAGVTHTQHSGAKATFEQFFFAPGINDLGDVSLVAPPALLIGRVVGAATEDPPELTIERRDGERWRRVRDLTTTHGQAGAFEVFGEAPAGELRLRVEGNAYLPVPPRVFVAGTTDLEVRLERGATLHARVQVARGTPTSTLRLELVQLGVANAETRVAYAEGDGHPPRFRMAGRRRRVDSDFTWRGLPAGTYVLRVMTAGATAPIRTIEAIAVQPAVDNTDPRLDPIDLRDALQAVTVTVRTADGAAIPADSAIWFVDGAPRRRCRSRPMAWRT